MDINALFYQKYMYVLNKRERTHPKDGYGRYIVGKIIRAVEKQRAKGRKPYVLHERGGHF